MSARTPVLVRFPPALLGRVDEARGPLNRHAFLIDLIERAVVRSPVTPQREPVPQAPPDAGESKTAPAVDCSAAVEGGMPTADLQEPPDAEPEGMTLDGTPPVHEGRPEPSEIRDSDGEIGPGIIADEPSVAFERARTDLDGEPESPIELAVPERYEPSEEFGGAGLDEEELDLPDELTSDAWYIGGLESEGLT